MALTRNGFAAGAPDGKMGPRIRGAIEAYLRVNCMSVKGPSLVTAAHGLAYDPYTHKMTILDDGEVGTFTDGTDLATFDVPGFDELDQGALDGLGQPRRPPAFHHVRAAADPGPADFDV